MSAVTPEALLWNGMRGALVTRVLAIMADLHVADALAGGPRSVEDLSRENGADADTLHRLLRALASDGIFAEQAPGVFRNTETSALLAGDGGWRDFAHLFGGVWLRTVATAAFWLLGAVAVAAPCCGVRAVIPGGPAVWAGKSAAKGGQLPLTTWRA